MMAKNPTRQAINMDIKNSMALLLHPDPSLQQEAERNSHLRVLNFPRQQVHREMDIFTWRFKTSLPIVKPIEYVLNQNQRSPSSYQLIRSQSPINQMGNRSFQRQTPTNPERQCVSSGYQSEGCELLVQIEEIKCRLSDIGSLPFSQILYLLKEMMIGYDVLIDKFGTFSPSEEMVAVSRGGQWKVWINEDFAKNKKNEEEAEIGEREFIYRLVLLAEKHCIGTPLSKTFFGEIKQYSYSNDCRFIRILEKIKQFTSNNRIYQVNKVVLPGDKPQYPQNATYNNLNSSECLAYKHKPVSKLQLSKKLSFQHPVGAGGMRSPTYAAMNRSNFNFIDNGGCKASQFAPNRQQRQNNSFLQQSRSQKLINYSSILYNPNPQPNNHGVYQPSFQNPVNQSREVVNESLRFGRNPQKPISSSYLPNNVERKFMNVFKSPQVIPNKALSPPVPMQRKATSFANLTKSRHELKNLVGQNLVSQKKDQLPVKLKSPQPVRAGKPQRKYSQQIFKAKSVDLLAKKLIHGSNIYEQDPEIKQKGVNVIKINNINQNDSPTKPIKAYPSSSFKTTQKSTAVKGAGSSTPNNSSNSTKQLQKSRDQMGNRQVNYEYLKANDLKVRNNQSSCYGVGGYSEEQKRQKNMAISCSFRNREQNSSASATPASQQKQQKNEGNNWTKKISGLFSDDASIKQLKGSVKFKTADEQRFQKQYLKDVKLQMLQKFGRPVRHSIVDQQEDGFDPMSKNPYQSMQLIEEVIDDQGKSYMEKEQEREDQDAPIMRGRHHTVQVINFKLEEEVTAGRIEQRECVSYECSEKSSQQEQFNFQSQGYIINPK